MCAVCFDCNLRGCRVVCSEFAACGCCLSVVAGCILTACECSLCDEAAGAVYVAAESSMSAADVSAA